MGRKEKYELDRVCAYCEHATPLAGGEHVLCEKRGVVKGTHHCRKFTYDPQKRIPKRAKPLPEVELDTLDDTVTSQEDSKETKEEALEDKNEEGETIARVLPCLELPDAEEIP